MDKFLCERLGKLSHSSVAVLLLVLWPLVGCSRNENLAFVSGTVTLDGDPLPKAFLIFTPQDGKGAPAFGKTDQSGRYQLYFSDTVKGAWIGRNRVTISTADAISPEKTTPERVPATYNTQSDLFEQVDPGSNTFDFDLESTGPVKKEKPYTG